MNEKPEQTSQPEPPATLAARVGAPLDLPTPEHPDVAEWRGATADDIDAMHAVMDAADRVDHPTWTTPREDIADTFELPEIDHATDTLLAFAPDGALMGLATSHQHPDTAKKVKAMLEGAVHPDWRRRGIGTQLMRWQYARALQILAAVDTTVPGEMELYVTETNSGATVIAESLGLRTARWFTTMERDMTVPLPEPAEPALPVQAFDAEHAESTRLAKNDAFRDHWGSLENSPQRWAQFIEGKAFRSELSTIALDGDRVAAFCLASVNEHDFENLGASHSYIDLIGVARDYRGRGLAPAVIAHTLRAIADAGLERAVLDVDTDSPTGANDLYENLGFSATERDRVLTRGF